MNLGYADDSDCFGFVFELLRPNRPYTFKLEVLYWQSNIDKPPLTWTANSQTCTGTPFPVHFDKSSYRTGDGYWLSNLC